MRRSTHPAALAAIMIGLGSLAGCGSSTKASSSGTSSADGGVTVAADAGGGAPVAITASDQSDTAQSFAIAPVTVETHVSTIQPAISQVSRRRVSTSHIPITLRDKWCGRSARLGRHRLSICRERFLARQLRRAFE